nr:hypothetical protein [Tanacetum cinerariifolium]
MLFCPKVIRNDQRTLKSPERIKINITKLSNLDVYGTAITMDMFRESSSDYYPYRNYDQIGCSCTYLQAMWMLQQEIYG